MKRQTGSAVAVGLAVLLAASLAAAQAQAQGFFSGHRTGRFVLPFEVAWAGQTLAPGPYSLTVLPRSSSPIVVQVSGQGREVLISAMQFSACGSRDGRLTIVPSGSGHAVRSLELDGLRATFVIPRRKAIEQGLPRSAEATVPIRVAVER